MANKNENSAAQEAAKKALAALQAKKESGTDTKAATRTTAEPAATKTADKSATRTKVQHNITHVDQQSTSKEELLAVTRANARPYRVAAIILWIVAIACEVLAILCFKKVFKWDFVQNNPGWYISWIVCLALDLICVIVGSQMWKKGNHLDPASEKNKTRFWLHNNLGVIVSVIAFAPFIIFVLTDKKATKQSKTIAAIVAVVALLVAGLTSVDWNPVSQEEMLEEAGIESGATYELVYWTKSGTVFHYYEDCGHLDHSIELFSGTSVAAVEAGKTRMCKTCYDKAVREGAISAEDGETTDNSGTDNTDKTGDEGDVDGSDNETSQVDIGN